MKKILVIVFMIASSATFAQVQTAPQENKTFEYRAKLIETRCQQMKTDLGLNDQQTAQILAMFIRQQQEREVVRAEMASLRANGQLTDEQKKGMMLKMEAQKADMDAQLKNILSPGQYTAWQNKLGMMKIQYENPQPAKG